MLLNLSNHPAAAWSAEQKATAVELYSIIEDLPFPVIDPHASTEDIQRIAEDYFIFIRNKAIEQPLTVHLMGEMTFTFVLVLLLISHDIPCVASTTERRVIEEVDGKKTVQFGFVQFRRYGLKMSDIGRTRNNA
jgi:hypothetical protein